MSGPIALALRILLALALYAFLGWTVWTIAQDLRRTGTQISSRKIPPIRLDVRDHGSANISRTFEKAEIVLGRDPHCDVFLDDETVSARHARLNYHHNHWWIQDLQSTNGTSLNKGRVRTPTVLTPGDEILCGEVLVSIDLGIETIVLPNRDTD